jgi:hypothetical protein
MLHGADLFLDGRGGGSDGEINNGSANRNYIPVMYSHKPMKILAYIFFLDYISRSDIKNCNKLLFIIIIYQCSHRFRLRNVNNWMIMNELERKWKKMVMI